MSAADDFVRRIRECAKRREPVTLFGVDYVAEEELEFERTENSWAREFLNRIWPKCGKPDCPSLVAYVNGLQTENTALRKLVRCLLEVTHPADRAQLITNAAEAMAELLGEEVGA